MKENIVFYCASCGNMTEHGQKMAAGGDSIYRAYICNECGNLEDKRDVDSVIK